MDDSVFDEVELTLFHTKFVRAGPDGGRGVRAPVSALLQAYDHDVHYATYTEPSCMRVKKDLPHGAMVFRVLVYDLDMHDTKPTNADFEVLLATAKTLSHRPNWVSRGRGGSHFLYVTNEIENPLAYEVTRGAFGEELSVLLAHTGYTFDTKVSDYTRLWRAPRVIRTDKIEDEEELLIRYEHTDMRESRVEVLHENVLDVRPYFSEPKPPPARRTAPVVQLPDGIRENLARRWISTQLGAVSGKGGHGRTFGVACQLFSRFGLDLETALVLMTDWNERCTPPWSQRELEHKVRDAERRVLEERNTDV